LGRIDHQVKVRGFRIELGEIESQLLGHPKVKETVVLAREGEGGDKYLCAYVVPHAGETLQDSELRDYLAVELPDYMVPAYFILLEKMPLNPNGKVDRKALPEPDLTSGREYVPPQNEREKVLVHLWSEVLGVDRRQVGIHDNFFRLGGHSLKAAGLVGRIHKAFSVEIPIAELFKIPTVKGISDYIEKTGESIYSSLTHVEEREYYPLSSAQKGLFVIHQMDPVQVHITYNLPAVMILEGELERARLEKTFGELINRYESLRTSFEIIDEAPVQKIHKEVEFGIDFYSDTGTKVEVKVEVEEERTHSAHLSESSRSIIKRFIRPFDLSRPPLLRVGLIKVEEKKHILMFDMHHIISDGVSMGVFIKEFMTYYKDEALPGLRLQYKDFSYWQNSLLASAEMKKQEVYWQKQFEGEIPVLNLPADYGRPSVQQFEGEWISFEIEEEMERLNQLALETGSTLYMVLLSLFNIFLAKVSSQEDIVVGSPVAGRNHPDLEQIIGIFINTLALRNYPAGEKKVKAFLREVRDKTLRAQENQEYPFEDLVELVEVNRDTSRNPLFDVMLVFQNMEKKELQIPGLTLKEYPHENKKSKFDMTFTCIEQDNKLSFTITYSTALFNKETIERFIGYFKRIVFDVLENSGRSISEIDILSTGEKQRLLIDFNNTVTEYEYQEYKAIHRLFEEQVSKTPDDIAIVGTGFDLFHRGENHQFTYSEFNRMSNQLARLLRAKGVCADTITAIMTEPSLEMIVGIMAILKAGGTYLPMDPRHPDERIKYMINDSETRLLLTQASFVHRIPFEIELINIEEIDIYKGKGTNLDSISGPIDLVYTVYTSGSTGKPKGVLLKHENLVNYVCWFTHNVDLIKKDRTVLTSSFGFDLGYTSVFPSILTGCQLHILREEIYLSPENLISYIVKNEISYIKLTPSLFTAIVESSEFTWENSRSLRLVVLGGEEIKLKDVEKAHAIGEHIQIMNHYGPTEATIGCVARFIDFGTFEDYLKRPTIGYPIGNMKVSILDKRLNMVAVGVSGELCVSGTGVVRGYLNHPELTVEKFVAHPYIDGEQMYRTGDMARWLAGGTVEFLGRIDSQIKIRGYRIELGEIENRLFAHQAIKEAVIILRQHLSGDKYLCAYIVLNSVDDGINLSELKEYLSETLPDYMIPSHVVQLEKIPLTPNGKLNRKLLPEPESGNRVAGFVEPRDRIEKKQVELWQEILEVDRIGIDDNFFQLGGHSLKAIMLASKIHKVMDVKVPLTEIFKTPTIRGLSPFIKGKYITRTGEDRYIDIVPVEKAEYYALSSAQKRLFILHQLDEIGTGYNMPRVLELEGEIDGNHLENTFKKLINRHESFRTSFEVIGDEPVQKIHEKVDFEIEYYEVNTPRLFHDHHSKVGSFEPATGSANTQNARSLIENFVRPFDLSQPPLLRVGLIHTQPFPSLRAHPPQEGNSVNSYILVVDMHHIVSDGVSTDILVKEFTALYSQEELPKIPIQYKEFSEWQHILHQKEVMIKQEKFWLKEFEDYLPVLNLPIDFPRPAVQSFQGDRIRFDLGREKTLLLKKLTLEEDATLFMILLALYYIFLNKIGGDEDIIVGTPIAGRRHEDLQKVIGMFVNTLALRNFPGEAKTFREFLKDVKEKTLSAFENQDYQFEELVEKLMINRDVSRNPLFDTVFTFHNLADPDGEANGSETQGTGSPESFTYENKISKFDLTLVGTEVDKNFHFIFEFSTKLFKKRTIERLVTYFERIVDLMIENPRLKICRIEIISAKEKIRLLEDFNDTRAGYPTDRTIHELFEEQVRKTPENAAVILENHSFSYRALNRMSNQLARVLREKGVKPDTIVGIMARPSFVMVVGIFAVLKAGGAYLPIDVGYPEMRIKYMLKDSDVPLLLTQTVYSETAVNLCEVIDLEEESLFIGSEDNIENINKPGDLSYVIYTSGSTGAPKGVLIEHKTLVNLCYWHNSSFRVSASDKALKYAGFGFDASVWEIFPYLIVGAELFIIDEELRLDVYELNKYIQKKRITIAFLPTQICEEFMDYYGTSLKTLLTGGDKLKKYRPGDYRLVNNYGPTENTVVTTSFLVDGAYENIPIGRPISNNRIYILDKNGNLQPIGIPGELCISGGGLAKGYLNNGELAFEKFVEHPFIQGERMYRTGDLALWLPNGNIEFLGRLDHQVKIRGYRIEPGEIEAQLLRHDFVREVVVSVGEEEGNGSKYLCAYWVPVNTDGAGESKEFEKSRLRDYLFDKLPDYMIPSYFVEIEKIPMTPNGKIDRKALPIPEVKREVEYIAPRDSIEKKLVEIWSQLLGSHETPMENLLIGINDNFFQLGGHSLKAANLISKIYKVFHVKVPLAEIFKKPTIRELSQYIKAEEKERYISIEPAEEKEAYQLSSAQKRFYLLHQLDLESTAYNITEAVIMEGVLEVATLEDTFKKLIHRHESLRTSFHMIGDEAVQRIHKEVEFRIEFYDFIRTKAEIEEGPDGAYSEALHAPCSMPYSSAVKNFIRPFDLSRAPLLRVGLLKDEEQKYILVIDMHHIVSDGISMNVLEKEFKGLYDGEVLAPIRIQYKDFSEWQNRLFQSGKIKKQQEYWIKQFEKKPPLLNLPFDYPRPEIQSTEGDRVRFELSPEDSEALKTMASKAETTLYMMLLAMFNVFLSKICRQEDIVVGSITAGRKHTDLDQVIGLFVNILPMRNYPNGEKTFMAFLQEVRESTIKSLENQDYQFEELVSKVVGKRDLSRQPISDVGFTLQNIDRGSDNLSKPMPDYEIAHSRIYLSLVALETGKQVALIFEYGKKLFKRETIEKFINNFKAIISDVIKSPRKKIKEIDMIPEDKKNNIRSRIQQVEESLVAEFDID
jgi:tyrocidine synthetase-3